MYRALVLLLLSGACGRDQAGSSWTVIDGQHGDVHAAVGAASREATRRGLVPVLYLSADYTIASTWLRRLRDERPMRDALRGVAVIEVAPELGYEDLRTGYWHSFLALDADGKPTGPTLDPHTKDGACAGGDAGACATWIRPFTRSLSPSP